jgi:hypothetical protein
MAIRLRNASLFYKSIRGANVGDLYMSLIFTAEMNGENAFQYLCALFENEGSLADDPAQWLPWTFRATLAARTLTQHATTPALGRRAARASAARPFASSASSP